MKLIFCVTLSLALTNFNVDSVDKIRKLEEFNEEDYKTKFIDLNMDCFFLILERLDFVELLNAAQINDEFSIIATAVFRRQYSPFQIVIPDVFPLPQNRTELLNVAGMEIDTEAIERVNRDLQQLLNDPPIVSDDRIELKNGDQILKTFKHFGHAIKRFRSNECLQNGPLHSELIGKLISKYSAESLIDVFIVHIAETFLRHIKKPLISVERVSFQGNDKSVNYQSVRLEELFPAVRHLNLLTLTVDSLAYFDYHMPNLEHLTIHGCLLQSDSPTPDVLLKNPQIRSIDLYGVDLAFVQKVNALLPQLETFKLSTFTPQNVRIQFANVTVFCAGYYTTTGNLRFPRIRTLHVNYNEYYFDEYQTFLSVHNHLEHIHLKYWEMDDAKFKQLIDNLPNLTEITLEQIHKINLLSTAVIAECLRRNANVKQLKTINFPANRNVELQQQLQNEWKIKIDGAKMSFERKFNYQIY